MVKRFLGSARRFMLNRFDSPALVLLYHRVTRLEWDPHLLAVSPGNFYEQVNYLRKNCALLTIEEFYHILSQRKKFPRKAVVLSFDDGYADNYHEALPILESLQSQALFFITTSNLDSDRELYWDDLERIVMGNHALPPNIEIEHKDGHIQLDLRTQESRKKTYIFLCPLLRFAPTDERTRIMDYLRAMTGLSVAGRPSHRMLSNNELQAFSRSSSVVIGAHTHNHPSLAVLPYAEQLKEIQLSKEILEALTGNTIPYFSYPYGSKQDYNNNSVKACRELGFKMVFSNHYGQVHSWTDTMRVPRVLVRDWNKQQFAQHLSKFFSY